MNSSAQKASHQIGSPTMIRNSDNGDQTTSSPQFNRFANVLRLWVRTIVAVSFVLTGSLICCVSAIVACPFCPTSLAPTLNERTDVASCVVLVEWLRVIPGKSDQQKDDRDQADDVSDEGSTEYRVINVLKSCDESPPEMSVITLPFERRSKPKVQEIWFGSLSKKTLDWNSAIFANSTIADYISSAPAKGATAKARLDYFVKFLEHNEPALADDAFREFAKTNFEDVRLIAEKLESQQIRGWLTSTKIPAERRGLYGMMLGLSGSDEDAEFLKTLVTPNTDEIRIGIDGAMAGYLMLTGEEGLTALEKSKIEDRQSSFSEVYALVQALRFMHTYGSDKLPPKRLAAALRKLVDRRSVSDVVANDLARWKDWTIQDRLMEMFDDPEYNIPTIRQAIIGYQLASTLDFEEKDNAEPPPHVIKGRNNVEILRKKAPDKVARAERFLIIRDAEPRSK